MKNSGRKIILFLVLTMAMNSFYGTCASYGETTKQKQVKVPKETASETEPNIEEEIELNKNLILPNQSPGALPTDIDRTRQYYQNMTEFSPRKEKSDDKDDVIMPETSLTLPPRKDPNSPTVLIKDVTISQSAIFSNQELENFKSLVKNKETSVEDLNNLIYVINKEYQKKNYITAKAFIPVTNLKGGALHVELLEAKIGKIVILNNKYNRTFFLKSRLTQKEGDIFDLQTLENDLRRFNKLSNGVKLTAKLKPGATYGTTDILVNADESFPLHLTPSFDNFGRDSTGIMRGGVALSADNVVGIQDRLTGAINLSRSSVTPFVDYNVPINKNGTRVGASYMHGNANITDGMYSNGFNINSKTSIYSAYITHPLVEKDRFSLALNTSFNYKNSNTTINDYNYTGMNDQTIAVGLNGRYDFDNAVLYFSNFITNGIINDTILGTSKYFAKYNGDAFYVRYFKNGIILTAKAGVQAMPQDVPFIEQYQIGGISTVRGYSESLLLGQSAYFGSLEALFPIPFLPKDITIPTKNDKKKTFKIRDNIKFATFFDNGAVFRTDEKVTNNNFLSSVGFGLRMSLSKYLTARVYWGFGLMTVEPGQRTARFHFDLISTPF